MDCCYRPTTCIVSPKYSKLPKKQTSKSPKIAVVDGRQPHCHLIPLPRGTPANIRIHLIFQKLRVIVLFLSWVYLYSHFCNRLQNTHVFCSRVRISRSRSSKVDDFGTNRKRVCDFLLVSHCDYGPISHRS